MLDYYYKKPQAGSVDNLNKIEIKTNVVYTE